MFRDDCRPKAHTYKVHRPCNRIRKQEARNKQWPIDFSDSGWLLAGKYTREWIRQSLKLGAVHMKVPTTSEMRSAATRLSSVQRIHGRLYTIILLHRPSWLKWRQRSRLITLYEYLCYIIYKLLVGEAK
jgi:hypothetical protein